MSDQSDKLEFEGTVETSNKSMFKVKVSDNYNVLCTLSGKIRYNDIRILVGDSVLIEVSEYDTSRGRITRRLKGSI